MLNQEKACNKLHIWKKKRPLSNIDNTPTIGKHLHTNSSSISFIQQIQDGWNPYTLLIAPYNYRSKQINHTIHIHSHTIKPHRHDTEDDNRQDNYTAIRTHRRWYEWCSCAINRYNNKTPEITRPRVADYLYVHRRKQFTCHTMSRLYKYAVSLAHYSLAHTHYEYGQSSTI